LNASILSTPALKRRAIVVRASDAKNVGVAAPHRIVALPHGIQKNAAKTWNLDSSFEDSKGRIGAKGKRAVEAGFRRQRIPEKGTGYLECQRPLIRQEFSRD